jgi:hypothetical protein
MVIFQAIGAAASFVEEAEAKAEIKKIVVDNQAILDAVGAKVNANQEPINLEDKREQALLELQDENPLFEEAVADALWPLVKNFLP